MQIHTAEPFPECASTKEKILTAASCFAVKFRLMFPAGHRGLSPRRIYAFIYPKSSILNIPSTRVFCNENFITPVSFPIFASGSSLADVEDPVFPLQQSPRAFAAIPAALL